MVAHLGIGKSQMASSVEWETRELARREQLYRGTRPFPDLTGKTVIVVDDGLATGASMRVAVEALNFIGGPIFFSELVGSGSLVKTGCRTCWQDVKPNAGQTTLWRVWSRSRTRRVPRRDGSLRV